MVSRPGSTTPEDGVTVKQESEPGAPSIGRSSMASEHEERPAASWSSEGTFMTGHGANDEQEAYEEQFAGPDAAPTGTAQDLDVSRGPPGRKPAKAEDQQPPTAKAAVKRKSKKKKKLRVPGSADESPSKPEGKDAGQQYMTEELDYALGRTELFRQLERNPILSFLKPKMIGKLTGPFRVPDFASLMNVRLAVRALFGVHRDLGFVLGAFEMERVHDWDLAAWKHAIQVILDPLTILVGTVEREAAPSPVDRKPTPTPMSPPRYQSSVDSDSSVESPKRMPMQAERPPRVMELTAAPPRVEIPATSEGTIPKALEDAITRLMRSTMMRTPTAQAPPAQPEPTAVPQQAYVDVATESVSSHSTSRPKHRRREQDDDPDNLFDLEAGTLGTAATISAATAGTNLTRVRLSSFSELKEFHRRDTSEEKAPAWLNRVKSASRRDGMTGDEVCALFGDLMAGPARQWYLQLTKKVRKSWPDLMEQSRIQYCGKGVSMASRYYHATKHPDETPLEYLYRLNVAGMRAKIRYADGTTEEKREHVELFINTLGSLEEELASRLTLMEIPDAATLEKKLRARQRGLAHHKKTLFGSNKFRQKAPAPPQPTRAVHAIQVASDEYDSGRESRGSDDQMYDQDWDEEERAKLFVAGQAPPGEIARRGLDADDSGRERPRCCHCGSRRHADGDCWSLFVEGPLVTQL